MTADEMIARENARVAGMLASVEKYVAAGRAEDVALKCAYEAVEYARALRDRLHVLGVLVKDERMPAKRREVLARGIERILSLATGAPLEDIPEETEPWTGPPPEPAPIPWERCYFVENTKNERVTRTAAENFQITTCPACGVPTARFDGKPEDA